MTVERSIGIVANSMAVRRFKKKKKNGKIQKELITNYTKWKQTRNG